MAPKPRPFDHFYIPEPNTGCWLWLGAVNEHQYGVRCLPAGKKTKAHRISYEMAKGPIPDGLVIDHLCRMKCCVNPDHLEAVTQSINVTRSNLARTYPVSELSLFERRRLYRQSEKGKATKLRELQNRKLRVLA